MMQERLRCAIGEKTRDLSGSLLLSGLDMKVIGSENWEKLRQLRGAIVIFFPHTGHTDEIILRKCFPPDLRRKIVLLAAADYWDTKDLMGQIKKIGSTLFCLSIPFIRDQKQIAGVTRSLK